MRHLAYWSLPNLALALALFPGVVLRTAAADASVQPSAESRPAGGSSNFDLLVYGFSYHPDQEAAHAQQVDNEFNPGLGLNYEFRKTEKGVAYFGVGLYRDSGRNWAKLAGPGYQFRLGDRWRLGAGFLLLKSPTYHNGDLLFAPIPLLTYDLGSVKINAFYAPQYRQYNTLDVFGLYFGIPL
jgi:hypothetical protein